MEATARNLMAQTEMVRAEEEEQAAWRAVRPSVTARTLQMEAEDGMRLVGDHIELLAADDAVQSLAGVLAQREKTLKPSCQVSAAEAALVEDHVTPVNL